MPLPPFNIAERNLLRHEFLVRFGQAPSLANGIWLRVWRGGPQAGQPKILAAVASMLERGLVEIRPDSIGFRAHFTPAGIAALSTLAQDRRALDPKQGSVKNLGRYAASWIAWWPNRPSSTAALT